MQVKKELWYSCESLAYEEKAENHFAELKFKNRSLPLGKRIYSMAILNVTPDSFSDGGKYFGLDKAVAAVEAMLEAGIEVVDIGGESTRPGSIVVPADEELSRILPVIEAVRKLSNDIVISIDTYKSSVAREALKAGADIINDIYSLQADKDMAAVVAEAGAGVILMNHPSYYRPNFSLSKIFPERAFLQAVPEAEVAVLEEVDILQAQRIFLNKSLRIAEKAGIEFDHIMLDPGLGFGLSLYENLELVRELDDLKKSGLPVLLAPSRKRFIKDCVGQGTEALELGTSAVLAYGVAKGADMIRFHDVETQQKVKITAEAIHYGPEAISRFKDESQPEFCAGAYKNSGEVKPAEEKASKGEHASAGEKDETGEEKALIAEKLLNSDCNREDKIVMKGMKFYSHIGVFDEEKRNARPYVVDLELAYSFGGFIENDQYEKVIDYGSVFLTIEKFFEEASDDLIESAAERLCRELFDKFEKIIAIKLRLCKPEAPIDGEFTYMAVEIERHRDKEIYLALGSNMGNREEQLQKALAYLQENGIVEIDKLSSVYESSAYGYEEQPDFLNMVLRGKTRLLPFELLSKLKQCEIDLGRQERERWHEREIDIDILYYDGMHIEDEKLQIPHKDALNRDFVLYPCEEILSGKIHENQNLRYYSRIELDQK